MSTFPQRPFFSKDFSPRGGGIDFLGLRWVNLEMLGRDLLPEINNVTQDMGTFGLGAWIPWKFHKLCREKADCTEVKYMLFREKVEVAISLQFHSEFSREDTLGKANNRIGATQRIKLPAKLTFSNAKRSKDNTIFAAALYGPAIRSLGLIRAYQILSADGASSLRVPMPAADADSTTIVETIDESLKHSSAYNRFVTLGSQIFSPEDVKSMGGAGFDPAYWRQAKFKEFKEAFRRKLLPVDPQSPSYRRTMTAQLILTTLDQRDGLTCDDLRYAWYTGMFNDGTALVQPDPDISRQQNFWCHFMARQYQRYAMETFLYCFELGLKDGCRTIEDHVANQIGGSKPKSGWPPTFNDILLQEAKGMARKDDTLTSQIWNKRVHPGHDRFEECDEGYDDLPCFCACRLLARWFWRMLIHYEDRSNKPLFELGGSDRMGMAWFLAWIQERRNMPLRDFLHDVFADLVFSQHMRVALSRFDGNAQRLRFMLGDSGIEPTAGISDLGERGIPWMPDRLDTFTYLLCDAEVLVRDDQGSLTPGKMAKKVWSAT